MARKNNILNDKKKFGAKFYTIFSAIIGVLTIGTVILLICLYNHFNTDTYRNRFEDWTEYKINYDELEDILEDPTTANHIFIFIYDETYMDQEEIDELDSDDTTRSSYEKANQALQAFYEAIEANHKAFEATEGNIYNRVEFYIINTSLTGNSNFLSDENYGAITTAPALVYLYGEKVSTTDPDDESTTLTGGAGNYVALTQILREARDFVQNKTDKAE